MVGNFGNMWQMNCGFEGLSENAFRVRSANFDGRQLWKHVADELWF